MAVDIVSDDTMPAGRFKAVCLKVLDEVAESRVPLTITKRGKPVARVVPVPSGEPVALFGAMASTVDGYADIESPAESEWDALR